MKCFWTELFVKPWLLSTLVFFLIRVEIPCQEEGIEDICILLIVYTKAIEMSRKLGLWQEKTTKIDNLACGVDNGFCPGSFLSPLVKFNGLIMDSLWTQYGLIMDSLWTN